MDCALTFTKQGNPELTSTFWQQWTQYHDQLYHCCLKLMNSNPTDAEDALSQAMLKAWEKVQKCAGKIENLKAWLFKLTKNLCIDIMRKRSQGAVTIESLECLGETEEIGITSTVASPESSLEREEKSTEIRQAIANLPETLRETFILHFYQELTHKEIAQYQGITYENVSRRISRGRKQLKEKLSGYFQEDVISSPVEDLHFGGKKAEGRRQKALDYEIAPFEDRAVETTSTPASKDLNTPYNTLYSHLAPVNKYLITLIRTINYSTLTVGLLPKSRKGVALGKLNFDFLGNLPAPMLWWRDTMVRKHPYDQLLTNAHNQNFDPSPLLTKVIQGDRILVGDGDSNGQNKIDIKELITQVVGYGLRLLAWPLVFCNCAQQIDTTINVPSQRMICKEWLINPPFL